MSAYHRQNLLNAQQSASSGYRLYIVNWKTMGAEGRNYFLKVEKNQED